MEYDLRQALPEGSGLSLREENTGNVWTGTVSHEIGRGGSCLVYRGVQRAFVGSAEVLRPVIIKEFYPKALDGSVHRAPDGKLTVPEDAQAAFDKRLSAFCAGQASHILFSAGHAARALPPLFASGRANGTFYAVSSPGQGVSLDQLDRTGMTLTDALALASSVSEAVYAVHQDGMRLYLDLKPSNIYVDENRAYLFDFDTVQPKERLRYCSCTSGWSAPEQEILDSRTGYQDVRKIGFQTDVFAIAAVFFSLLTGRKPTPEDLAAVQGRPDWKEWITLADPTGALESEPFISQLSRVMRSALQPDADRRAMDYGGSRAALKIKNEWDALSALAQSAPDKRGFEKTRASVEGVRADVHSAQSAVEETVRRYSLKNLLFGSKKRVALTALSLVLLAVAAGVIGALSGQIAGRVLSAAVYREDVTDSHLLLALENGSHSYELGLENWRRLDYARAERDLLNAREELSGQLSRENPDMARISNSLGCLYLDMGKYEQAYDCLNSAYVTFRDQKGENAAETMAVLFSIAQYDYLTGDPETAQRTLRRILDHTDTGQHPGAAACVLLYQARMHMDLGEHEAARADFDRTMALYRDILKDGRGLKDLSDYTNAAQLTENEKDKRAAAALWILRTQTAMAENALETGDNEQAVSILQPALDYCLADVNIGRKNLVTSRVYLILARAEQALGRVQDALDHIDMAMRIQLNLFNFSGEYPGLTEVYQAYGQILMEKGSSFEGGAYFQKALALAQASYGKNHALTAKAYDQTGLYEMKQGNASPAVEAFSEAVEIRRNILGYQHPETVRYLCHLAQAAEKSGDPDKTKEASLEAKRLCEQLKLQGELAEQVNAL